MCNLFNTSGHVAAPEMQLQEKKNLGTGGVSLDLSSLS